MQIKPADGKAAKEIAQIGVNNCGRELCLDCMKKEKARMEQEQKVKEESEGENNVSED